ncbi:MAG: hypothetical protein ACOYJY_02015 [Acutalibacteraceae bacterium]|jgi:cell division septum initiation protein DivIVA
MKEKELKRLSRLELVNLLLEETEENNRLKEQMQDMERQLQSREIAIRDAGSIAEASLQINRVFEAAQAAAQQYLENAARVSARQEIDSGRLIAEAGDRARQIEEEAARRAQALMEKTERECAEKRRKADAYWDTVTGRVDHFKQIVTQIQQTLQGSEGDDGAQQPVPDETDSPAAS